MSKKSEWIIEIRDGIPHLTDRKELIRCKDCTYWDEATVNSKGFLICPASGMEITETDYCSYGERRSE